MSRNPAMIEVVRHRLGDVAADELLTFWAQRGALFDEQARQRLPEIVCLVRVDGSIAGVSSAYEADVALIGGRRFWMYRSLLDESLAGTWPALIGATFNALEAEFDGSPGSPVGLCALIADREERRRRPEAEWSEPRMIYAGYLDDGRQVRIAYFEGAEIGR